MWLVEIMYESDDTNICNFAVPGYLIQMAIESN